MADDFLRRISTKWKQPKDYQQEIFKRAVDENVIAVLPTGYGKTMIASLLIYYYYTHPNFKQNLIIFLAPTQVLASQQANVIVSDIRQLFRDFSFNLTLLVEDPLDFFCNADADEDVNLYNWNYPETWKRLLDASRQNAAWLKTKSSLCQPKQANTQFSEISSSSDASTSSDQSSSPSRLPSIGLKRVFVMTPGKFLHILCHGFLSLSRVALLVFDECHNVAGHSPYAEIMNTFYHEIPELGKTKAKTRILGLTATFVTTFPKYCVNKDTIMKHTYSTLQKFECIYDARLISKNVFPLVKTEECFYLSSPLHLDWWKTIDTLFWHPFFKFLELDYGTLSSQVTTLTKNEYIALNKDVAEISCGIPLKTCNSRLSEEWARRLLHRSATTEYCTRLTKFKTAWMEFSLKTQHAYLKFWNDFRRTCGSAVAEFGAWSFILIMDHFDERISRKAFLKSCAVTSNSDDEREVETPAKQPTHLAPVAEGCPTPVSASPRTLDDSIIDSSLAAPLLKRHIETGLVELIIAFYQYFCLKTSIRSLIKRVSVGGLNDIYDLKLVSPKLLELERVLRESLKALQAEELQTDDDEWWLLGRSCADASAESKEQSIGGERRHVPHVYQPQDREITVSVPCRLNSSARCDEAPVTNAPHESSHFIAAGASQVSTVKQCATLNDTASLKLLQHDNSNEVLSYEHQIRKQENARSHLDVTHSLQQKLVPSLHQSQPLTSRYGICYREGYRNSSLRCLVFCKNRLDTWLANEYCHLRNIPRTGWITGVAHSDSFLNYVSHETTGLSKQYEKLQRFRMSSPKTDAYTNILFCTSVILEGMDLENCNAVVLFEPVTSFLQYLQSRGRIRTTVEKLEYQHKLFIPSEYGKTYDLNAELLHLQETHLLHCLEDYTKDFSSTELINNDQLVPQQKENLVDYLYQPTTHACIGVNSAKRILHTILMLLLASRDQVYLRKTFNEKRLQSVIDICLDPSGVLVPLPLIRNYQELFVELPVSTVIAEFQTAKTNEERKGQFLALLKLMYKSSILNDHFLPPSTTQLQSTAAQRLKLSQLSNQSELVIESWREPSAEILCPDDSNWIAILRDTMFTQQFYLFNGKKKYTPAFSLMMSRCQSCKIPLNVVSSPDTVALVSSLTTGSLTSCSPETQLFGKHQCVESDCTSGCLTLAQDSDAILSLYVHRVYCCLESSESAILASGGLMGLWRPYYTSTVDAPKIFDIPLQTTKEDCQVDSTRCPGLCFFNHDTQSHQYQPLFSGQTTTSVGDQWVMSLSKNVMRVLMPLAFLLPSRLSETVSLIGCEDTVGEAMRVDIEPLGSELNAGKISFTKQEAECLVAYCNELLHLVDIQNLTWRSVLSSFETVESLTAYLENTGAHWTCATPPFVLFAPLMPDGIRLDFQSVLVFLKLRFLCYSAKKFFRVFPNSSNHTMQHTPLTLNDYWSMYPDFVSSYFRLVPGFSYPLKHPHYPLCDILMQIPANVRRLRDSWVQENHSLLTHNVSYPVLYTDLSLEKKKELVTHVLKCLKDPASLESSTEPDFWVAELFEMLQRRGMEPPMIRLVHEGSRTHRYSGLYAVDMENTPDSCHPIASEFTLKENYDVFCGRLISSSALDRPSFVFMGPIFRQGPRNLFIDTVHKPSNSHIHTHYAPQYAWLLPLTDPIARQLTWLPSIMFKLDIWMKHYEFYNRFNNRIADLFEALKPTLFATRVSVPRALHYISASPNAAPLQISFQSFTLKFLLIERALTTPAARSETHDIELKNPKLRSRYLSIVHPDPHHVKKLCLFQSLQGEVAYQSLSGFQGDWNSQRLEFLGDAVLKCIVTIWSFFLLPKADEHQLTLQASSLLSNKFLAACCCDNRIHTYLWARRFSRTLNKRGGSIVEQRCQNISSKMQADVIEAFLGAVYLSNSSSFSSMSNIKDSFLAAKFDELFPVENTYQNSSPRATTSFGLFCAAAFFDILTAKRESDKVNFSFSLLLSFLPILSDQVTVSRPLLKKTPSGKSKRSPLTKVAASKADEKFITWFSTRCSTEKLNLVRETYAQCTNANYPDVDFSSINPLRMSGCCLPCSNAVFQDAWLCTLEHPRFKHQGLLTMARTHSSAVVGSEELDISKTRAEHFFRLTVSYNRLEFLGDGLLSFLLTEWLYMTYKNFEEGALSAVRSVLQSNVFLACKLLRKFQSRTDCKASELLLHCLPDTVLRPLDAFQQDLAAIPEDQDYHFTVKYLSTQSPTLSNPSTVFESPIASPSLSSLKILGDLYESILGALYIDTGFNLEISWLSIANDFQSVQDALLRTPCDPSRGFLIPA